MTKTSPTQRSLKLLRSEGYTCQVVEKWNQWAGIRQDLFGFIDIVCIKSGERGVLGIQTTSTGNVNARIKKISGNPIYPLWLEVGNKIVVEGWSKRGARGKVKHWTVKRIPMEI